MSRSFEKKRSASLKCVLMILLGTGVLKVLAAPAITIEEGSNLLARVAGVPSGAILANSFPAKTSCFVPGSGGFISSQEYTGSELYQGVMKSSGKLDCAAGKTCVVDTHPKGLPIVRVGLTPIDTANAGRQYKFASAAVSYHVDNQQNFATCA